VPPCPLRRRPARRRSAPRRVTQRRSAQRGGARAGHRAARTVPAGGPWSCTLACPSGVCCQQAVPPFPFGAHTACVAFFFFWQPAWCVGGRGAPPPRGAPPRRRARHRHAGHTGMDQTRGGDRARACRASPGGKWAAPAVPPGWRRPTLAVGDRVPCHPHQLPRPSQSTRTHCCAASTSDPRLRAARVGVASGTPQPPRPAATSTNCVYPQP